MDDETPDDYAIERVGWIARDLAGNMLRVMQGAGKPPELFGQIEALGAAINAAKASVFEFNEIRTRDSATPFGRHLSRVTLTPI
jgi:hypothetical protein